MGGGWLVRGSGLEGWKSRREGQRWGKGERGSEKGRHQRSLRVLRETALSPGWIKNYGARGAWRWLGIEGRVVGGA